MGENAVQDPLEGLQIRRASTAEQVAEALRETIVSGELPPGAPLREAQLAASIGISRNTVREAVRLLSRQGLVTHTMHRGAVVTRLSERDVADLFRVRGALETQAIELSGEAAPERLRALGEAVAEMERAAEQEDWDGVVEADRLFHERLVALLGSRRLDAFFSTVQTELRLCLSIVDPQEGSPAAVLAEHRELYDLIAAGERTRCRALMEEHLADNEARLRGIAREWDHLRETG